MWLGRVPAERHITRTYHTGVTVTEVEREPAWLDDDRAWAMALLLEEAEECSGCGVPTAEAHNPERELTGDGAHFYWTATPVRCFACAAKDRATRDMHADVEDKRAYDGLMWSVKPTEQ